MTDDIRALTARLAEEPGSLAFLDLGETLRRRGQLDAALKVARGGVTRYPRLVDAHDLLARILCDRGELSDAFDAWAEALRIDPLHPAALKGIAFLYFRAGDMAAARQCLERALEADPDDPSIPAALGRLAVGAMPAAGPALVTHDAKAMPVVTPAPLDGVPDGAGGHGHIAAGMLLADMQGMRLRGDLSDLGPHDRASVAVADAVAAELAGAAKEAGRTARVLELGAWASVTIESPDAQLIIVPPTTDTALLFAGRPDVPLAQVHREAAQAADAARVWLERGR